MVEEEVASLGAEVVETFFPVLGDSDLPLGVWDLLWQLKSFSYSTNGLPVSLHNAIKYLKPSVI
jgi:hypothetical protein